MKVIEVFANPYIAVDKDGIPQGVVGTPGARGSYVGAHLDLVLSAKTGKTRFYFPPGAVRVPLDPAICNAVLEGSLIAADKTSAHLCGVRDDFHEPEQALADEQAKALEYFRALNGADAVLKDVPTEATPLPADPAATSQPAVRISPTLTLRSGEGQA